MRIWISLFLLFSATVCSTPQETGTRVFVRQLRPVSFGRLVQTVNALRLASSRSDPMQAAFGAAMAHVVSVWYGLEPFDESSQEEEAYLLRFCRAAGWDEKTVSGCVRRIYQTVLEQASEAVLEFAEMPLLKEDAENLMLELESLHQEPQFPSLAIWMLGERRVKLAAAHRRRLPPGLPLMIQDGRFSVFGSAEVPLTETARIREILEHASALEPPAAVSLLAAEDERIGPVLMVLGIARAAGIARIWAWGAHDGRSAAVELELVAERPALPEGMPVLDGNDAAADGVDVSGFSTWGEALASLSGQKPPLRLRVPVFRSAPEQDATIPVPPLSEIRRRLIEPEP